uniref:E3 ubiquitin-protein ligase n=1 Tax=Globodera pallida TaxID=36090 RepID=A0A183C7D1_GLOPA
MSNPGSVPPSPTSSSTGASDAMTYSAPVNQRSMARISASTQAATMMVNSIPAGLAAPQQMPQTSQTIAATVISAAGGSAVLQMGQQNSNSEFLSAFECPVCLVSIRSFGLRKLPSKDHGMPYMSRPNSEHTKPWDGEDCSKGSLNDVMSHLMKLHKSITTLQGEDIVFLATDINLPGAVDWVMMQSCYNAFFMLVLEKQDKQEQSGQSYQMFYAVVQLIGTKKEAENFVYKLELSNNRRRLCWEASPRSIHEGVAAAISQSDCLAFDTNHANFFAENGNLGINVTIQRADVMNR